MLTQLDVVMGKNVGSAMIDSGFKDLVLDRLRRAEEVEPLNIDIDDTTWLMSRSREYQSYKCDLG